MDQYKKQLNDLTTLLKKQKLETFLGYDVDFNGYLPPQKHELVYSILFKLDLEILEPFYTVCDGISLPDIWNGYFIHTIFQISKNQQYNLSQSQNMSIIVFGSDGGGGQFAISKVGEIYYLPVGEIIGKEYRGKHRLVANSFLSFIDKLVCDAKAFLLDQRPHVYLDGLSSR